MSPRIRTVAEEWLRRANSNLARAKQPKPEGVYWEDLCFDAQQAAEKAIKAIFILHGKRFPYSHNIAELLEELETFVSEIPDSVRAATSLTDYAVATRYPSFGPKVTEEEYLETIKKADAAVEWCGRFLVSG